VQGDEIAVEDLLDGAVFGVAGLAGQRRVVQDGGHAQRSAFIGDAGADIADADDPDGFAGQVEFMFFAECQQGGGDVFGDAVGVGAGGGGKPDAVLSQIIPVDVFESNGGGGDKADTAAGQQGAVDLGDTAYQQGIGIGDEVGCDFSPGAEFDVAQMGKTRFDKRDILVGYNLHRFSRNRGLYPNSTCVVCAFCAELSSTKKGLWTICQRPSGINRIDRIYLVSSSIQPSTSLRSVMLISPMCAMRNVFSFRSP